VSLPDKPKKGGGRRLAFGAISLALVVLAFFPLAGSWSDRGTSIPVFRAERAPFELRVPAQGNLRAVRATPVSVPAGAPGPFRIAWMAPDGARVRTGEVVVRFDSTELVKELADSRDDGESTGLKIGKQKVQSRTEIDKLDSDAGLARQELETASQFQKKDEVVFSRHEIIESEIDRDLAKEKEGHARDARRTQETLGATELDLLGIERRKAEIKRIQAEQGLSALEVTAPYDGVLILKRNFRGEPVRVGDTVWNGQPLAEIPNLTEMEAEVFVLEADAGGLAPGKRATVILESRPDVAYPAEIRRVDPLAKPRLRGSPVQYFAVTLKLAETDPKLMKPGQRVRATLFLEERKETIAVPRQAVFDQEEKKIVYRRRGATFEPVEVTLGPSGMGRVVLEKGIEPGDEVALVDPTRPRNEPEEEGEEGSSSAPVPTAPGGTS
jgi:hypothetical protein